MKQFDLAVIGGGPGGYSAAEYAAARGKRVVLFEKDQLGGTCLNRGCIPAKAMLHAGEILTEIRDADRFGIHVGEAEVDFPKIHEEKNRVIGELRRGVEKLMQTCKVEVVCGSAVITGERTITCGEETYQADDIILATGSVPAIPPIPGADLPGICTSNEIFEGAGKDFASIVIIGGGVIGVETACFYLTLGRQVTIIEAQSELLPLMDKEIAGQTDVSVKPNVTTNLWKRYAFTNAGEEMKYLAVTTYNDGVDQTILFELKSNVAPTPDPRSLYSTVQKGDKSDAVTTLQKRLIELGYLSGDADGNFGEKTAAAVTAAQKDYEMEQSGVATPEFQARLFSDDQPEPEPTPEPTEVSPD